MALEPGLQFDHVAVTVPDLDAAVEWYCMTSCFSVAWREDWTDAPARPLGLPGETVRLRGSASAWARACTSNCMRCRRRAWLSAGWARRIGHFAFRTTDIDALHARLVAAGVSFRSGPQYIAAGGLAGERWAYAEDPWGWPGTCASTRHGRRFQRASGPSPPGG
jgi:catechol 2,3-dioxygenase-like lactoylglutathione lyase family enzyme